MPKASTQREELPVIFRTYDGEVTAYFPTLTERGGFFIRCYAHMGQHSEADRVWLRMGRPAGPKEYADLLTELRGIYERGDEQDPPVTLKVYRKATGKAALQ